MPALRSFSLLASLTLLSLTASPSSLAQGTSAKQAIGALSTQFGPQSVQWIAEMEALGGVPQPARWEVLAYDSRAPLLLYRFRSGAGQVADGGTEMQRYPVDLPVGYFSINQVMVDSVAAFTIAEAEARKAKINFDSCDYFLRVREYTTEPIWRLELRDTARRVVGKVYLSGITGQVMRTLWVYSGARGRPDGTIRIVDSAAPGSASFTSTDPQQLLDTNRLPGDSGIAGMPPREPLTIPTQPTQPTPAIPPATQAPMASRDDGIPEPPQIPRTAPSTVPQSGDIPAPPVAGTTTEIPSASGQGMRDLRDEIPATTRPDPAKPPIEIPEGSTGSSERIPPPPIPQ